MLKRTFWIICSIVCLTIQIDAQSFGAQPWNLKWFQLEQEDIRVIYPAGFEDKAQHVFSILGYLHDNHRATIGVQTDHIELVLNNRTNLSNGYVGLAPFRSEFYTTPPQNNYALGSLPWLDLLAIHEYRHVLQFSNGRRGISRILSVLFGQSAFAGAINIAVPDWYFEGDAVMAETAMSPQGRGRIPHFLRAYKAYEAEGRRFKYGKVRNGSFKDFIPDHYRIGYLMNKYGADQHGSTFWSGVLADAGAYKGLIYPFSNAIKNRTGNNVAEFYEETFDHYHSEWADAQAEPTASEAIIKDVDRVFTNYRMPQYDNAGNLYYLRSGLQSIHEVYRYDGQSAKKLFALGITSDPYIDIHADKITWAELRFHPIRGNVDFSVIMTYDIKTKAKKQVTASTRLSSPTIHPDGKIIAAVEIDQFGSNHLKVISSRDGLEIKNMPNEEGYFLTYPKWTSDGKGLIIAARDQIGRMAICRQDYESGKIDVLSPWSDHPMGIPHVTAEYIYYSQSGKAAEHIYRVAIAGGTPELVVTSAFGAYQPYIYKDEVLYTKYTADGLKLARSKIDPIPIFKDNRKSGDNDPVYQAYGGDIRPNISKMPNAAAKKYGKLSRPLNFHSWGVVADDQTASLQIESDNILNNVSLSAGYQYIFTDNRSLWNVGARMGFFYPFLAANYTIEGRSFIDPSDGSIIDFNESTLSLGLEAPLNLSSGTYIRTLFPHYSIERIGLSGERLNDFDLLSQEVGLIFLNRRLRTHQDVLAKYSQFININYRGSIDELEASQLNIETEYTFPGILSTHALRVELDYKRQNDDPDYNFPNRFDFARGYNTINSARALRLGFNYHLPMIYPEFGIAGIGYLQRIQANIFYDYSRLSTGENSVNLSSTGLELLFDTKLMNTVPVTLGLRYSRTLDIKDNVFEFFIPFYRF